MPHPRSRNVGAHVLVFLGSWLATWSSQGLAWEDLVARPIRGETPAGAPIQFLGTNSCSANACHNRGVSRGAAELSLFEPRADWELMYWQRFDPHARAYAVLETEQSRRIEWALRGPTNLGPHSAEQDTLCLSCHVHQNYNNAVHAPEFSPSDGVSCESCHGASQYWTASHYQLGWESLSTQQKASIGFVPHDSLADRARSCMPCHVGSAINDPSLGLVDVNHDLIAAGHPRLSFEFASYHSRYPKHWDDREERRGDPSFEARAWLVGQLAGAEASLLILRARAGRSVRSSPDSMPPPLNLSGDPGPHTGPWPEFAEYNCYACHHDLQGGVPLKLGIDSASPGQFTWGTWYPPMTNAIAREFPPRGRDWPGLLASIEAEMNKPLPDRERVMVRVDEATRMIDAWLDDLRDRPLDFGTLDRLLSAAIDQSRTPSAPTWDRSAQVYLAMAALHAAQGDLDSSRRNPVLVEAMDKILDRLAFRGNSNSPPEYRIEELEAILSAIEHQADSEE